MARQPRIEFAGAIYHVISRGNYRKDLVLEDGSARAFEKALMQASARCGWRVHGYVVMRNHYHLCLEAPRGNLAEGMRWLQGTYGNRFNRYHGEGGHVFQGRYKALLVEPGEALLAVVNYIHLNPGRTGVCKVEKLKEYPWSSYPKYFARKRPEVLCREAFLAAAGFDVGHRGMKRYETLLRSWEEKDPKKRKEERLRLCGGWAIGTEDWKNSLGKEFGKMDRAKDWGGKALRELNELQWEQVVKKEMRKGRKSEAALHRAPKGVEWKVKIARRLRRETSASNPWIAQRLHMGHPTRVSNLINQYM